MNTTLPRARSLVASAQPAPDRWELAEFDALAPRISPLDRLSLRLGLWLLLRSTRSVRRVRSHDVQVQARANERARLSRERAAERLRLLSVRT